MAFLNIEIKARSSNHEFVRDRLLAEQAAFRGKDHQIDTYFKVANGRLKLREGNIENALIHYHRPDQEGPKASEVTLYQSEPESNLKAILTNALGIFKVVDKQREIYFIENVKFHIDTVMDLGSFVEIEAIDRTGEIGKEKLLDQCRYYMDLLGISEEDLVEGSYSDML